MISASAKKACAMAVLSAMEEVINSGIIKTECLKANGSFRKSCKKDAHELTKFVHRMIQFHSGMNISIPTTTEFFLQNFADEVLGQKGFRYGSEEWKSMFTVYILDNGVEELYNRLDNYAEQLTEEFGFNKYRAASIWGRCF